MIQINFMCIDFPLVEQELLTNPVHPSSPLVFSGIRLAQYLAICVVFC